MKNKKICGSHPIKLSWAWKQPSLYDFLTKTRIKLGLVLNPNHETRKIRIKTWHMWNKNPTKNLLQEKKKIMTRKYTQN
jgi:hypothetical protein